MMLSCRKISEPVQRDYRVSFPSVDATGVVQTGLAARRFPDRLWRASVACCQN
jgi:hypothetical protein